MMFGWGFVAGSVVVTEWVLARSGRPLLSHDCWRLRETKDGAALVAAVTATLAWHLNVPNRPWRDALKFGAAAGAATWLTTEERR